MTVDSSETLPASTTDNLPPEPLSHRARWTRRIAFAGAALGVVAATSFMLQRSGEAALSTEPAADVPRVFGDQIRFSDGFAQRAGIRIGKLRFDQMVPVVAAVGTADFNAEHVAAIGTRLRGLVSRVTKFEGDVVEAGAVLARVESAELGEAQAAVSMLDAERHAAELNAERETKLAERSLTTARELELASVEAKKANLLLGAAQQKVTALGGNARPGHDLVLGAHEVRSPIGGTVVERNVAPGQFVEGQLVAFKVADLDHLWIELDVFERNLSRVMVGDRAELRPLSATADVLNGRVAKVASRIDQETHSAKVRIEVENQDRKLRVGQAVQATIHTSGGNLAARPIAPTAAITFVDGKPTVFVSAGPNAVRVASVELGANDGDETEILAGLDAHDQIVVEGAFALKSEALPLMLAALVSASIRARSAVIAALCLLLLVGVWAGKTLPIDALPDVSPVQVSVLTSATGLSPVEVERTVTTPIENALNGVPGAVDQRSVSRGGLSAVTVIFGDKVDIWFARQLVLERLRGVELPASATAPEAAPVSSGLGEIFQFVVQSEQHSAMQLRTMLDWDIVPKLRNVPGVVEVNTMGGQLKQFQVVIDRTRLKVHGLSINDVVDALRSANVNAGGGYIDRREESFTVRGQGMLTNADEIGAVMIRTSAQNTPVLVRHVADVTIGGALRQGVITHDGKGEAVTGIVMMLLGENSRDVVQAVGERVTQIQKSLPAGVEIEVIYDRSDFVGRTLHTVMKNLAEGVVIVTLVLCLFLGSLRGAIAVVLGIPVAMTVALLGMHAFGVTGDLMSLGAIDFGFLVDGPIVILESVIAATAGRRLLGAARAGAYAEVASAVARPVVFAVAIIMLVYVPLLALEGVEGKMFRPMAVTMACALFGALIYAVTFFPAVLVALVPPAKGHGPRWLEYLARVYSNALPVIVRLRWGFVAGACGVLALSGWLFARQGAEFVPRIFEGDAVVTIRRAPSISLDAALKLDLAAERVLHGFPEVTTTLGMTGRAEVATDPVGNDNTDLLVRLKPLEEWQTAKDFDTLSEQFKNRIESRVPGTFVSVSQPIEDRTNELISGSRADVQIQIFGTDLPRLAELAGKVADRVRRISGTGDVRVERVLGAPTITASVDRARLARYGVRVEDAFAAISASREGVAVGHLYEEERRFEIRVLSPPSSPTADGIGELFVPTQRSENIPLREVVELTEGEGPTAIRRENRLRAIRVDVNLRGRDLVSWVNEAQAAVTKSVALPTGYRAEWGGQFENFARAQARLAIVLPIVVLLIFGMLLGMFQNVRLAVAVFALVPLSLAGGMLGLTLRGMPFSLPAAVGFIALGGIAVLNGVVMASEVRWRLDLRETLDTAIAGGCAHVLRAVLTTAVVAALGFLPMATATSAGAEVQQPLATAVVLGMLISTLLTLLVLPGVLRITLQGYRSAEPLVPQPTPPLVPDTAVPQVALG